MLTKHSLGLAISTAIKLKLDTKKVKSKAAIAREFGVKPSSLAEWEKYGSISKDKIGKLIDYFSDVVTIDHWGITEDEAAVWLSLTKNKKTPHHSRQLVQQICDISEQINDAGLQQIIGFATCLLATHRLAPQKKEREGDQHGGMAAA